MASMHMNSLIESHDTALPFAKLPSEILSIVFLEYFYIYRDELEVESKQAKRTFKDRGVVITHVCKFWRSVALDFPPIWAFLHIPSFSIAQVDEYILRSKQAKVSLYYTSVPNSASVPSAVQKSYNKEILDRVQNLMGRIEVLRLTDIREPKMQEVMRSILSSVQTLSSLSLSTYYSTFISRTIHPSLVLTTENVTLPCHLSSITELILTGAFPSSEMFHFNSLSTLVLNVMKISFKDILSILADCSGHLTSLVLTNIELITEKDHHEQLRQIGSIRLSKLHKLHLSMNIHDYEQLKRCIEFGDMHKMLYRCSLHMSDFHGKSKPFKSYLERHFSTINLAHKELKLIVDATNNSLSLQVEDFQQEYCVKHSDIWELSTELYASMHDIISIHVLESLVITFFGVDSRGGSKHGFEVLWDLEEEEEEEEYSSDLDALENLLREANSLQRLRLILPDRNDMGIMPFQSKILDMLQLFCLEPQFPNLHVIYLENFSFNNRDKEEFRPFLDALLRWNRPETVIQFMKPQYLRKEIVKKVYNAVSNVKFEGHSYAGPG